MLRTNHKYQKTGSAKIPTTSQAGFTLVEVMVAVTVFAIGILSINIMQTASITGNSTARGITEASTWGSDQIEQILGWSYTDARLTDSNTIGTAGFLGNNAVAADAATSDGSTTSSDGAYTIIWNVADNVPTTDTKTIEINVIRPNSTKPVTFMYVKPKI